MMYDFTIGESDIILLIKKTEILKQTLSTK
jgi:hypothetical protein